VAAKKMPKAGRAARTSAKKVPVRKPGVLKGSIRQRAGADKPFNPTGHVTPAPKNP
jgi:hypothetical protein